MIVRLIPKNIRVKTTIFACYTFKDVCVLFIMALLVIIAYFAIGLIGAIISVLIDVIMMIPTKEGPFYSICMDYLKFSFSKKTINDSENITKIRKIEDDGEIFLTSGEKAFLIKVEEKNFALLSENEQNHDIERLSKALAIASVDSTLKLLKTDGRVFLNNHAEKLCELLGEEKRNDNNENKIKVLESRLALIDELNSSDASIRPLYAFMVISSDKNKALKSASILLMRLTELDLSPSIMNGDESLKFLISFYMGIDSVDNSLPKKATLSYSHFNLDGQKKVALILRDYPLGVGNAWGASLLSRRGLSACITLNQIGKDEALRRIDRSLSEMESRVLTTSRASETGDATSHIDTLHALLKSIQRDNESIFDVSAIFLCSSAISSEIKKAIKNEGFNLSVATALQGRALQSIFSIKQRTEWQRSLNSTSLGAIYPFVAGRVFDENGIALGLSENGPFVLDIWKRDKLHQNSNAFVLGRPGSGKSYFMKNMLLQQWSEGVNLIVLDPESEYGHLAKKLGGDVIDVSGTDGKINPFHVYGGEAGEDRLGAHLKTLETFFAIVLPGVSEDVREGINRLTLLAYERKGITGQSNIDVLNENDYPTFSFLKEIALESKEFASLITHLDKFVGGRYDGLWNGPSTLNPQSDFIVFDFRSLFNLHNDISANAQMLLILGYIEKRIMTGLKRRSMQRTIVSVDEAHMFINPKIPEALDFFSSMSKRIRKYNGSFIPATQNISDWMSTSELKNKSSAIIKNSQYTFIFKLSAPDLNDLTAIYGQAGEFGEEESKAVLSCGTGNALFMGCEKDRLIANIVAPAEVQNLLASENEMAPE